jgi:hypothetical protein
LSNKIIPGADLMMAGSSQFLGVGEPIKIFRGLQDGAKQFAGGVFSAIQEVGQLQVGLSALQQAANFGPFQALIRQNIELRENLIATQSSLAATNNVVLAG